MRSALLLGLVLQAAALRLPAPAGVTRAATVRLLLALPLTLSLPQHASANPQQKLLELAGITLPGPELPKLEEPPSETEFLLAQRVREAVARQEKAAGFALDATDVDGVVEVMRNKYCGKQGIGFTLSDGSHGSC